MTDQITKSEFKKINNELFDKFQDEIVGFKLDITKLISGYTDDIHKKIDNFTKKITKTLDDHSTTLDKHSKQLTTHDNVLENHCITITNIEKDMMALKKNAPKDIKINKGWFIGGIIYAITQLALFGINIYLVIKMFGGKV